MPSKTQVCGGNTAPLDEPKANCIQDDTYKESKRVADDSIARNERTYNEEDGDDQDVGPELPPGDDGDDEEGRFFGGGISKQESQILDYVDDAGEDNAQGKFDNAWLRRTALNFEKQISKNAEMRAKFEDEPQKFIGSEADLDSSIKDLSILPEHPELYTEFVRLNCTASLVGLLAHENTDIAIDAIEIISELTDEDVTATEAQWNELVDSLMDADMVDLLVSNFSRLNEDDESDRNGVYYALGVLENLCSRSTISSIIGQDEKLLKWLLSRIQKKENAVSQNKQYAAEVIAILAQAASDNRQRLVKLGTIDTLLQLVSAYRKQDPDRGSEEEEYMENLFEALVCLVDEAMGKEKFVEAEGVELCLITMKDGKSARPSALRVMDHASSGEGSHIVCSKIVEAGGLKNVFTLFMKTRDQKVTEHILVILSNMLRVLPSDCAERIRTLAKFVEKEYEKIRRLVNLRQEYDLRIKRGEQQFRQEWKANMQPQDDSFEVELMSSRLDSGLFTLQLIDTLLAWLVAEDDGAKRTISALLTNTDNSLASLAATLQGQLNSIDEGDEKNQDVRDMLGTLLELIQ